MDRLTDGHKTTAYIALQSVAR